MSDESDVGSMTQDTAAGLEQVLSMCIAWHDVGSRVSCNPPPADTDRDILCIVLDDAAFVAEAESKGFHAGGSLVGRLGEAIQQRAFVSLRNGDVNLIVTMDPLFARRFLLATRLATRLNLLNKDDRVALFQAVLYGNG
jgi:hypothetical protein